MLLKFLKYSVFEFLLFEFGSGVLFGLLLYQRFWLLKQSRIWIERRLIPFVTIPTFTNAVYTVYTFCRKQGTLGHHKRKLILEFRFSSTVQVPWTNLIYRLIVACFQESSRFLLTLKRKFYKWFSNIRSYPNHAAGGCCKSAAKTVLTHSKTSEKIFIHYWKTSIA